MAKINKTEKYLLLIQTICKAPMLKLSEAKVIELFENPSRATFYRDMAELCSDSGTRKALLQKVKDSEGNTYFQLNHCDWYAYLEGNLELKFVLKAYREMGHLFPHFEIEVVKPDIKDHNRKFIYHATTRPKDSSASHSVLETIIRSLLGSRKLLISYKTKTIDIYPLTLCQHRDELYLLAYKNEMADKNLRTYKVSRIAVAQETNNKFKYPSKLKWDQQDYFKSSSGLIVKNIEKAIFRVFGHSRTDLLPKH